MRNRSRITLKKTAPIFVLLAFLAGCQSSIHDEAQSQMEAADKATIAAAPTGLGYICEGDDEVITCVCKKGSTGPLSCVGMDRICRIIGAPPPLCGPPLSLGWCVCGEVLSVE